MFTFNICSVAAFENYLHKRVSKIAFGFRKLEPAPAELMTQTLWTVNEWKYTKKKGGNQKEIFSKKF